MKRFAVLFGLSLFVLFLSAPVSAGDCVGKRCDQGKNRPERKPPTPSPRMIDWKSYILMGPHDLAGGVRGQKEDDLFRWHSEGISECFNGGEWCGRMRPGDVVGNFHTSYELNLETAALIPGLPSGNGWTAWAHNIKDPEGNVAEFAAWHPEKGIVLFWEVSGVVQGVDLTGRPRIWMHSDDVGKSWEPGVWWAPNFAQFPFLHVIRENRYSCSSGGEPIPGEWLGVGFGVSQIFGPWDIGTPEARKKTARILRNMKMVPAWLSDERAVPREWADELRQAAGDGTVHLIVKTDWLDTVLPGTRKPDLVEHYFYLSANVDSDHPFGGGIVRWNVREGKVFFQQGTALRLVEKFGRGRTSAKLFCEN